MMCVDIAFGGPLVRHLNFHFLHCSKGRMTYGTCTDMTATKRKQVNCLACRGRAKMKAVNSRSNNKMQ